MLVAYYHGVYKEKEMNGHSGLILSKERFILVFLILMIVITLKKEYTYTRSFR